MRKRLSEDILPIYTAGQVQPGMDQEEGEASPGTVILQDLREVERTLAVLLQLMAAVEGKTEAQVGSRDLSAMVQKCRDSDIDVHPAIDAWLVVRALETMEVESDEFKSCLDPKCQEAPESCYTISMLSKDRKMQTTVQRRVICQHLGMIMEEPRNSEVLQAFVPVVLQVEILCPDLQEELEDLQRMFSPQDLEANVLNKLTQSRRKYIGSMLDTKPTGIEILRAVAAEWEQRLEDRQLGTHLAEAMESLQTIDKVELAAGGCLRKAMAFKICHLAVVKSKEGSTFFQRSKAVDVTRLKEIFGEGRVRLLNHFAASCVRGFAGFMIENQVLEVGRERFKELDFDALTVRMKTSLQEVSQRLKAISEMDDAVWQDLKEQEMRWLGLSNGMRKFLSSLLHGSASSVFLDAEFEHFRALLFELALVCKDREGNALLVALRDRIVQAAVGSISTHEQLLAACAMCVRGEFAEISMGCQEQGACWESVGKDKVRWSECV